MPKMKNQMSGPTNKPSGTHTGAGSAPVTVRKANPKPSQTMYSEKMKKEHRG